MNPRISIITPVLNQAQYLEQTIDSVLSQNYSNLEYIIIDGGSSDGSVNIIKKYERHLTYWISEKDSGQSHGINKGIHKATGEVINWLNADDYLNSNALNFIADQFANPKVKVLCAKGNLVNENGEFIAHSKGTDFYENNLAKTIGWARIDQPETYFRRKAFNEVGVLNQNLHFLMDREWWVRYLLFYGLKGIVTSNKVLVNFRIHSSSKTVSCSEKFQWDHDSIFFNMSLNFGFIEISELIKRNCKINPDYFFQIQTQGKPHLIKDVLNYYLLHRSHEFYYLGLNQKLNEFFHLINKENLDEEGKKLYKKISIRSKLIPKFIKKFIRG